MSATENLIPKDIGNVIFYKDSVVSTKPRWFFVGEKKFGEDDVTCDDHWKDFRPSLTEIF